MANIKIYSPVIDRLGECILLGLGLKAMAYAGQGKEIM